MDDTTQDKGLAEKTVKELREMAKELPDVTGIHAMKKEELLALLAGGGAAATGEAPAEAKAAPKTKAKAKGAAKKAGGKKVKEMTRVELKGKLKELRQGKDEAKVTGKKAAAVLRRRINRLKKQSRRREAAA